MRGVNPERRPGGHGSEGFVVMSGPGVAAGRPFDGARLLDLAPTLLHLMDVPVPNDFDGRVLHEVLEN